MNTTTKHLISISLEDLISFSTLRPRRDVTYIIPNANTLREVLEQTNKNLNLFWKMKDGSKIKATLIHVLGQTRCVIDEHGFFTSTPRLITIADISSIERIN